ncbi:MAG: DUF5906 domain-containing protein [Coleofasciculaceae cyanobacterium]
MVITQLSVKPEAQTREAVTRWLTHYGYPALPVAPAQDPHQYHKVVSGKGGPYCPLYQNTNQPTPLFTGKNPSYLDKNGTPHLVNHKQFQKKLPSSRKLSEWFAHPDNGIGTLGGWHNTVWLDFDIKRFDSSSACDDAVARLTQKVVEKTGRRPFLEKSQSGGWRVGVKVKQLPDFTNFTLTPGGAHIGEALGNGRFTVLAPTLGPSGKHYKNIHREEPPEVESLEDIGIYPTKKNSTTPGKAEGSTTTGSVTGQRAEGRGQKAEGRGQRAEGESSGGGTSLLAIAPKQGFESPPKYFLLPSSKPAPQRIAPGIITLEQLGNKTSLEVLNGGDPKRDRSASLTTALKEWCGWYNWSHLNGVAISGSPEKLAHDAGHNLGIDESRVERIIKSIGDFSAYQPAALTCGGDEACWRRVRKLDKATFIQCCPTQIRESIQGSSSRRGKNDMLASSTSVPATMSFESRREEDKERRHSEWNVSEKSGIPDSFNPLEEFTQRVLYNLYGDKPWICVNGQLYFWTGTYYQASPDVIELRRLRDFCNTYPVLDKYGVSRYPYAKPSKVKEALEWVKISLGVDPALVNPPGLNCTNGVLQFHWEGPKPSWKLVPHDSDLFYIYEPQVTYNPESNPEACERLLSCLDLPQQDIFLKTIAASLDLPMVRSFKSRAVKALLLKGDGANGKDTLRELVRLMYGKQGVTSCTFSDFVAYDQGRKFPLARLRFSRLNWSSENSNVKRLDTIQSLKAFVTGDTLSIEGKGRDEYEFDPKGVALFNVNDTPNLEGVLEAIASRYGVLSFNKTFKVGADPSQGEIEAEPRFKYDPLFLRSEVLPAFLNKVLDALVRLMEEGIDYSCTFEALQTIQASNSHLFQFCQDTGLQYDQNGVLTAGQIWQQLQPWYEDNGTLSYEETANGKKKAVWQDQPRRGDRNVKAPNQVIGYFQKLFPKAKRITLRGENKAKLVALSGISFVPPDDGGGGGGGDGNNHPNTPTGDGCGDGIKHEQNKEVMPVMAVLEPPEEKKEKVEKVVGQNQESLPEIVVQQKVTEGENLGSLASTQESVRNTAISPSLTATITVNKTDITPVIQKVVESKKPHHTYTNEIYVELMRGSDLEIKRLGWSVAQAKEVTIKRYGKESRQLMSNQELEDFVEWLRGIPTPVEQELRVGMRVSYGELRGSLSGKTHDGRWYVKWDKLRREQKRRNVQLPARPMRVEELKVVKLKGGV